MLSEKHFEDSELELEVWEDRELVFVKFELWPDAQLLAYSGDELNFSNSSA